MNLKKLYLWATILPITISVMIALVILFFFRFLPPKLPLFYSLSWGEGQLAKHIEFLIIPGTLALVVLLNLSVASYLHEAQTFFKKILLVGILVPTLIFLVTILKIVLVFI